MTLRQRIIVAARRQEDDIGDCAMIAEMEWGYWVGGTVYVSKSEVIPNQKQGCYR